MNYKSYIYIIHTNIFIILIISDIITSYVNIFKSLHVLVLYV